MFSMQIDRRPEINRRQTTIETNTELYEISTQLPGSQGWNVQNRALVMSKTIHTIQDATKKRGLVMLCVALVLPEQRSPCSSLMSSQAN